MPFSNFTVTTDAVRTEVSQSAVIERGILEALTAYVFEPDSEAAHIYGEIGLATGHNLMSQRVAVLAQGYFGYTANLFWTGHIRLDPDMLLYGRFWGSAATIINISAKSRLV